jgi:hypothetical protein
LTEETQPLESPYQRKFVVLDEFNKTLLHQAFVGEMHAVKCMQLTIPTNAVQ